MRSDKKFLAEKAEVASLLKDHSTDIVLTLGAGDIDSIASDITEVLKSKK
jgi:UDP-N-acetylmuramate-alanine ligase